jgi:ribosomal-protein-alanine N-acetyltransferase
MLTLNFIPFPAIQTERLLLRKLEPDDKEAIFEIRSNPEIMKYLARPVAKTIADATAHLDNVLKNLQENTGIDWGLEERKSGKLIGTIALWRITKENYRGELGYVLNEKWQQKGFMHEALTAIIDYAFVQLELHSIEANVDPLNMASAKLLEKNKFRKEAHFKENVFFEGAFLDSVIYSLVKTIDYKQDKAILTF